MRFSTASSKTYQVLQSFDAAQLKITSSSWRGKHLEKAKILIEVYKQGRLNPVINGLVKTPIKGFHLYIVFYYVNTFIHYSYNVSLL